MIVREQPGSFLLFGQHEHALASGEFARHWRESSQPLESTLYAVTNHDLAWRELDGHVLWDEKRDRPYSFVHYPAALKLPAQRRGIEAVEERDPYAACLCSMHYARFLTHAKKPEEIEFRDDELDRQRRLRSGMTEEDLANLEHNLQFLRLCDGLSLFACLNEPGGEDQTPPYPGGFELGGQSFDLSWEDEHTLRLDPNPFTQPFGIEFPYQEVGRDRQPVGSGTIEIRVSTG